MIDNLFLHHIYLLLLLKHQLEKSKGTNQHNVLSFIYYDHTIILFVSAALSVMGHSNDLSNQCGRYAISLICHYSFPHCAMVPPGRGPEPLMICKDECEVLENNICREEYITAKHHALIGTPLYNYLLMAVILSPS